MAGARGMAGMATLGEIARLAGTSKQAVHKAGRRGFLDFDRDGRPDLDGPRTRAWIARQRARNAAPKVDGAVAAVDGAAVGSLAGLSATLHGRLYDIALWEANTVDTEAVRAELHDDADYWLRVAHALPVEAGCHIALVLAVPPAELVGRLDQAMADYLVRVGDQMPGSRR
jgi:hypothetical protein